MGLLPFSKPQSAPWNATIFHHDYLRLLRGFTPQDMDDKWVLQCIEPDPSSSKHGSVHLYRSWTGYENMRAELKLSTDAEADGNSSKECYVYFDKIWWETDSKRRVGLTEDGAKDEFVKLVKSLVDATVKDVDRARATL